MLGLDQVANARENLLVVQNSATFLTTGPVQKPVLITPAYLAGSCQALPPIAGEC
jgi:hypothetical protein